MLIARKKPDAIHVAGYRTWTSLGRFVRSGEKGIFILAPMPDGAHYRNTYMAELSVTLPYILQYRVKCPVFPHQSTGDQWFTESQFESYRRLGLHVAENTFQRAVGDLKNKSEDPDYSQQLFQQLRDIWYPPNKAIQENFTRHAQALDA